MTKDTNNVIVLDYEANKRKVTKEITDTTNYIEEGAAQFNTILKSEEVQGFATVLFNEKGSVSIILSGEIDTVRILGTLEVLKNEVLMNTVDVTQEDFYEDANDSDFEDQDD